MELKMIDSRLLIALVLAIAPLVQTEDSAQANNLEARAELADGLESAAGWPMSDGEQLRARLMRLEPSQLSPARLEQIRAALRRFLLEQSASSSSSSSSSNSNSNRHQLPSDSDYEPELRVLQKKADLMPAKEYSRLVETAIESAARKFTRDPMKSQESRLPDSQSPSVSASGHKSLRTEQPSYMRLPPRFGKRSYFAT